MSSERMESAWPIGSGVDQIGIVVRNVDHAVQLYSQILSVSPWDVRDAEFSQVSVHGRLTSFKARFAMAQMGAVQIELIQPVEGRTIYDEHLETKGEGLHHLGILVSNLEERVGQMAELGIPVIQSGKIGNSSFAYLDACKTAGVIFEFIAATRGMLKLFETIKHLGDPKDLAVTPATNS